MKRTIFLILLLGFSAYPGAEVEAEERRDTGTDGRRVQARFMFGLSIGDLVANPHEPHELSLGGTLGGGVEYVLSDRLQLEARAMLLDKASVYTDVIVPRPSDFYDVTVSLRYLAVPVLAKVRATRSGLYVFGGPELAFRTRARQVMARYPDGGNASKVTVNLDTDRALGRLARTDVAVAVGGGLQRALGHIRWNFEVYASRGLRNVLRESGYESFGFRADSLRTESVAFLTGLRF